MTDNQPCDQDQQITSIAEAVVKLKELRESNKNLNEPDIEEKFARLSLAFRTDKFSLRKRLDLQLRQRDIAEDNIDSELKTLRESLNALNQLCTESDMRDIIMKTQQHVDIVQQATKRMSSRAETYGAIQQEQRMNCAFETMLNYVEHLKLLYDKEHLELEEYRRLLAEHNLLPSENAMEDDPKRTLPPRSQSLSSSSKPEARTRLLSAVCLLNNNYEAPRINPNGNAGSLSPKSRRSSLPVGPLAHSTNATSQLSSNRAHTNVNGRQVAAERRESHAKSSQESHLARTESEESTSSKPEADSSCTLQEQPEEVTEKCTPIKDSSELKISKPCSSIMDQENISNLVNTLQESACDNESDICLLPDIIVPVKSKPLYVLNWIQRASARRIWQWDSATLIMHARYTMSALLATAAMFTLVLTFVPSKVIAHVMK